MKRFRSFSYLPGRQLAYSLLALVMLAQLCTQAFGFNPGKYLRFKHGAVYARAIIEGDNGQPIYVVYDEQGEEVREIGEVYGQYEGSSVMSGDTYRAYVDQLKALRQLHGSDSPLVSKDQYNSETFLDSAEQAIDKSDLREDTQVVLLRPQDQRTPKLPGEAEFERLILAEFPVDLIANPSLDESVPSIIISNEGIILERAQKGQNIGYKVGFFGDGDDQFTFRRRFDDKIHGPVQGVPLEIGGGAFIGGFGVTDEEGKYSIQYYLPPCPGFAFEHTTDVWAELNYRNFNPRGAPFIPYFLRRQDWTWCIDYASSPAFLGGGLLGIAAQANVAAIEATISTPSYNVDFPIEVAVLTGRAKFTNDVTGGGPGISFGGDTSFQVEPPETDKVPQPNYDFDGDGADDDAFIGKIVESTGEDGETIEVFEQDPEGDLQGVYLSSIPYEAGDLPHLTRLPDTNPDFSHQGLLEQISQSDLQETDLYVFRKSNGQLIIEREDLDQDEVPSSAQTGTDDSRNELFYKLLIRGPGDWTRFGRDRGPYTEWESTSILDESLQARESDNLRPGEEVQIIAINRATGYIGTTTAKMNQDGSIIKDDGSYDLDKPANVNIAVFVDKIEMGPPNLKVYARRTYKVKAGLTKDEERTLQVGFEGSALTDDTYVEIITEWYDHDGSPLPEELGDFGYTGRLARVVAPNKLEEVNSSISQFSICPGTHLNVLRLGGDGQVNLGKEHFYIHINGERKDGGEPNFGSTGQNEGILRYRPDKYVPFLVQMYNEKLSIDAQRAYRLARQENPDLELKKPAGVYEWYYRPEYQFSVFDLTLDSQGKGIFAVDEEDDSQRVNIYNEGTPVIGNSASFVEVFFSLLSNDDAPLEPFGAERELVMAFGEDEAEVTIGENGTVRFDNIENLTLLDVDDFLTMRLYANNDASNILWEWAFEYLDIVENTDPDNAYGDRIYISADDPTIEVSALLLSYENREPEDKNEVIEWFVEGDAMLENTRVEPSEDGLANNLVTLVPYDGNTVIVKARLLSSPEIVAESHKIVVIPGKPASISITKQGEAAVQGEGAVELFARVYDSSFNLVTDGTPIHFELDGSGYLNETQMAVTDGIAKTLVKGGNSSGPVIVEVSCGDVVVSQSININSLQISSSVPSNMTGGNAYPIQVQVQTLDDQLAEGVFVDVGVSKGILDRKQFHTDDNGNLSFTLHTPKISGEINLRLVADRSNAIDIPITITAGQSSGAQNQALVISGLGGATDDTFNSFDGTSKTIDYSQQGLVMFGGEANAPWTISFDKYHFINKEPVYFSRFRSLTFDDTQTVRSTFTATRSFDGPEPGFNSAYFASDSSDSEHWYVPFSVERKPLNPAFAFWVKVDGAGQILDVANRSLYLETNATGELIASLKTSQGTVSLSLSGVVEGQWHKVSVGLNDTEAWVALDDEVITTELVGAQIDYPGNPSEGTDSYKNWIALGNGFNGNISGFRIYNMASADMLSMSATAGNYDQAGKATITVSTTSNYEQTKTTTGLTTVGLKLDSSELLLVNVIPKNCYDEYAKAVADSKGLSSATVNDVTDNISFAEMYPSVDQALSSLYCSLLSSESVGPINVLISAMAWAGNRPEMESLHEYIQLFQAYYHANQELDLLYIASDYLAKALVEAQTGNNLRLITLRTGLVVWGELIESNPGAAQVIANAINNREDFWVWIRFMSLPANGWSGPIIPIPRPENTCDVVEPTINAGTVLAYSDTPCRTTGDVVGNVINGWVALDPKISANNSILTQEIKILIFALRGAPFEFTKMVFDISDNQVPIATNIPFVKTANAGLPAIAARLLIFMLKAGLKAGIKDAPGNLVNFMTNNTTSRFKAIDLIVAIAYLTSRDENFEGKGECSDCKYIRRDVHKVVNTNLGRWFAGLALADKGDVADENLVYKKCHLNNQAHGAALELVATAAYHALYEFAKIDKYEILAADKFIKIPIATKSRLPFKDLTDYGYSPYGRKPDLIMHGGDNGKRYWIELKSWQKGKNHVRGIPKELNDKIFVEWNPKRKNKRQTYAANAQKQFFLDFSASREALNEFYWDSKSPEINDMRPLSNRTWIQVWKQETRYYRPFVKVGKKWRLSKRKIPVDVATPWIDEDGVVSDLQIKNSDFDLLQKYLTDIPKMSNPAFEKTIGYRKTEHNRFIDEVQPFTLLNMLKVELGDDEKAKEILRKIAKELASSELAEYLGVGELSEEQLLELKDKIEKQVFENLGIIGDAIEFVDNATEAVGLGFILELEDKIQDHINGMVGDEVREFISSIELPESRFKEFCEAP